MANSFNGEIKMVSFNFAPQGWAACDGQLMPISQNQQLFSLLGTTYGGDGRATFALPDFRSRCALHKGQGPGLSERDLGEIGGEEVIRLLPSGAKISQTPTNPVPINFANPGIPVSNMQPYLVVNFIICLNGVFPQ